MLLALALVALLAGTAALSLGGLRRGAKLDQGLPDFETVLRMARADASGSGKRLRIAFEDGGLTTRVLIENQPLSEPETFADYLSCTWLNQAPNGLLRVERCELVGASAYAAVRADRPGRGAERDAMPSLTFYPDGSSDSAVIVLLSAEQSDERRGVVELDGLNGIIRTRILTPSEYEEEFGD